MERCAGQGKVLIVSDNPDRHGFLQFQIEFYCLSPIWYHNILSARKAVRTVPFFMVVVDFSLPIELKLILVKEVCHYQPDAQVITINKTKYIKKTGIFSSFSSVISIDSINLFPDELRANSVDDSCWRHAESEVMYPSTQFVH